MGQKPILVKSIDQKIRTFIAHFQTVKDGNPQFLADGKGSFIVGKIEFDPLGVGKIPIDIDVAVEKMIGNKNTGVT